MDRMIPADISIEWVIHDGRSARVSEFAGVKARRRPDVRCPECGAAVILKLGPVRRHHAAHRPGSVCIATNPETALHINVKYHFAAELSRAIGTGKALRVRRRCVVGNRRVDPSVDGTWAETAADACPEVNDEAWVTSWDEVHAEFRLNAPDGHRIPDVVLLENGVPVAALEILVSHQVDQDKANMLAAHGVPWIELRAAESLYRQPTAWTIEAPIEPERASFLENWRCELHAELHRRAREVEDRVASRVAEGPVAAPSIQSMRIADVYHRDGSAIRFVYRVTGITNFGVLRRLALECNGRVVSVHLLETGESADGFQARVAPLIRNEYEADLAAMRKHGAFADSPMRWLRGEEASTPPDSRRFPQRYRYRSDKQLWEMIPSLRPERWPVVTTAADARRSVESVMHGTKRNVQSSLRPRDDD